MSAMPAYWHSRFQYMLTASKCTCELLLKGFVSALARQARNAWGCYHWLKARELRRKIFWLLCWSGKTSGTWSVCLPEVPSETEPQLLPVATCSKTHILLASFPSIFILTAICLPMLNEITSCKMTCIQGFLWGEHNLNQTECEWWL